MESISNPFSLEGKRILITGASSGIGKSIALICNKMGAEVLLNGRNLAKLHSTQNQLIVPKRSSIYAFDLTQYDQTTQIVSDLPTLNGVVHCAGIGFRKLCRMIELEDINFIMDSNFKSSIHLQNLLLRKKKLCKNSSSIFIASLAAESPIFGNGLYSASKAALIAYANCMARELAPRHRVNCISPAMVWTDLITSSGISEDELKVDEARYPMGRYGQPEDIANLATYLLSDASSWMTGENIKITGGIKQL